MRRLATDTLVLAERNLVRLPRAPDLLIGFTIQPVMFVLLFAYVFGGAIVTPGYDYVDFLIPGIIVQNIAFGGFVTALGLSEDLKKGLIDRFRSLPTARASVLAGRTLADVVTNALSIVVLLVTGLIIGFDFDASVAEILGGVGLLLLFGFAFSWIFALIGMSVSSPEAANGVGFTLIFPITFISSAFVPVESMPAGLQPFAEVNPITVVVDAMRALWLGAPAGDSVWGAVAWSLALIAIFAPLAVAKYRRISGLAALCGAAPVGSIVQMVRTVLVVDDHAGFRELARTLLEDGGYAVVGEAGDGASALRAARALHPDAVLLDVHLPDMDGFAVAAALAREEPAPRVVLTSTDSEEEVASLLRRSGAIRFVPKETLAGASMHALWEAAT